MLVLRRRIGESFMLGDDSELTLEYVKNKTVAYFKYKSKSESFRVVMNRGTSMYIDGVVVFLIEDGSTRVKLGFESPSDVPIVRTELLNE